jgi:hypothetical protein
MKELLESIEVRSEELRLINEAATFDMISEIFSQYSEAIQEIADSIDAMAKKKDVYGNGDTAKKLRSAEVAIQSAKNKVKALGKGQIKLSKEIYTALGNTAAALGKHAENLTSEAFLANIRLVTSDETESEEVVPTTSVKDEDHIDLEEI